MEKERIKIDTNLLGAKLLKTAMLLKEPQKSSYQDFLDLWSNRPTKEKDKE